MLEAAQTLGVTCHVIRALIRDGILPARQVVFDAPWQIRAADLECPAVHAGSVVVGRAEDARATATSSALGAGPSRRLSARDTA
jgi:hypothetical protein